MEVKHKFYRDNNRLSAIDLFAGAGGLSLAAKNSGIDVLAAVEFDNIATETYRKNIVDSDFPTCVFNQDINDVDIQGLMKYQGLKKGQLDILLGGPPCQGFSSHRIKNSGVDDPRNKLLLRYFDFVKELMPKVFLVENVPGLLWERHKMYLANFTKETKKLGYKIICNKPIILNAKDYGVPQNRKRAFILAVRNDVYEKRIQWPPAPTHFNPNNKLPTWKTASTVFEKPSKKILDELHKIYSKKNDWTKDESSKFIKSLEFGTPVAKDDPCNIHMNHTPALTERFQQTPLNGSREDIDFTLPCHVNYKGHKDVYGRIFFHLPANTITTGCNNPSKGRFVHPWKNHGITLRHAARLQTFPDEFVFLGNSTEQARQIGNAVPIKLGEVLLDSIIEQILFKPNLKAVI